MTSEQFDHHLRVVLEGQVDMLLRERKQQVCEHYDGRNKRRDGRRSWKRIGRVIDAERREQYRKSRERRVAELQASDLAQRSEVGDVVVSATVKVEAETTAEYDRYFFMYVAGTASQSLCWMREDIRRSTCVFGCVCRHSV